MKILILETPADITPELAPKLVEAIARLLPQVSSSADAYASDTSALEKILAEMLETKTCVLFVAQEEEQIIGSLTLIFYPTPTAKKARIEDVVVDEAHRGKGIGLELNNAAIQKARELGAKYIDLTSKPDRTAANALYKKLGFEVRETNVYRLNL